VSLCVHEWEGSGLKHVEKLSLSSGHERVILDMLDGGALGGISKVR
jgi:hypothetical protein